jgi:hypothetical protein
MEVRANETGEVFTLSIIDRNSGLECIEIFLGNLDAFDIEAPQFSKAEGLDYYTADLDTIQWWQRYISGQEEADEAQETLYKRINALPSFMRDCWHEKLGDLITRHCAVDLEDLPRGILQAIAEVEAEMNEKDAEGEAEKAVEILEAEYQSEHDAAMRELFLP